MPEGARSTSSASRSQGNELPRTRHRLRRHRADHRPHGRALRRPPLGRLQAAEAGRAGTDPAHPGQHRRPADLAVGREQEPGHRGPAARRPGDLDLADRDPHRRLLRPHLDPRAGGRGSRQRRVPRAADRLGAGDGAALPGAEPGHLLRRDRDPLDPALHPLRHQPAPRGLARVRPQVPDRRLARLGDAALRDGLPLRRHRLDRVRGDRRRHRPQRRPQRPADPGRDRDVRGRARLQDLDRPLPPVDAGRLRGSADADHLVHGGGDQGRRLRRLPALLRRRPRPAGRASGSRRWRSWRRSRSSSATSAPSARTR